MLYAGRGGQRTWRNRSEDLRERVITAIEAGASRRAAAERFAAQGGVVVPLSRIPRRLEWSTEMLHSAPTRPPWMALNSGCHENFALGLGLQSLNFVHCALFDF